MKLTPNPASFEPLVAEFHVIFPAPSKSSEGIAETVGHPLLLTSPATLGQVSTESTTVSPSESGTAVPSLPPVILST